MSSQILGSTESLPIDELETYHKNPRQGDTGTIAQSLRTNGQFRPLVVNRGTHTGRPYEVLAGNHTLLAARELSGTEDAFPRLDCYVIDVEEDHARRIVLADNRTSDLATYDNHELIELLTATDDLAGTGWAEEDIELLSELTEGAPSLEELEDEFGTPEDDDFWITIKLRVPPVLNDQWKDWTRGYDSEEEAFEALLDKGTNYGEQ